MNDNDFCPQCGVTMDLHNDDDDCASAEAKADLMERFWSIGRTR